MGFKQGVASPGCLHHAEWGVQVVVHGDDFTALGNAAGLDRYKDGMKKAFEIKLKGRLWHDPEDLKEMRILNRILRVTSKGILYEPDPRHSEILIKSLGLEGANSQVTPGVKSKDDADQLLDNVEPLPDEELQSIIASIRAGPPRSPNKKGYHVTFKEEIDEETE